MKNLGFVPILSDEMLDSIAMGLFLLLGPVTIIGVCVWAVTNGRRENRLTYGLAAALGAIAWMALLVAMV